MYPGAAVVDDADGALVFVRHAELPASPTEFKYDPPVDVKLLALFEYSTGFVNVVLTAVALMLIPVCIAASSSSKQSA